VKRVGKLCLCLAGGLVLNASLRAAGTMSPGHPYAPIVVRNVFNIHPPPPVENKEDNKPPPLKITLNGIVSNLGHPQALYKVAMPAKPGIPPKDQFYMLGEGEAQDEIEVVKIDEKAGLVTFNNHGTEQEIPLADATASSGTPPAPAGPAPAGPAPGSVPRPGFFRPGFPPGGGNANNGSGLIRFGQPGVGVSGGQNPNINGANNANNNGANPNSRLGVAMGGAGGYSSQPSSQQTQAPLSADEQATMITYNHAVAVAKGDPTAVIYPPTEYDSEAGVPSNVAPPPTPGGTP